MGKKKKSNPGPGTSSKNRKGNANGRHHKKGLGKNLDVDGKFRESLEADGRYTIKEIAADGNCLFGSLSDQLFHDHGNKHAEVRSALCDFIETHEDEFSGFLVLDEDEDDEDAADFESYVRNMREDGEWGGNLELVAAARLYRRNIMVFSANLSALTINHDNKESSGPDLLLSYHDNDHYSSVHGNDPPKPPTNGVSCPTENNASIKKNDPCPCGSGRKFKKCCLEKEAHASRVHKMSQSKPGRNNDPVGPDEMFEMNGEFRVLKI